MARYLVSLKKTGMHAVPSLLAKLGAFVAALPHGSLGWFDAMTTEPIPKTWSKPHAKKLTEAGFAFLQIPDGSLVALLHVGKAQPVVLLGSEGEARTLADSLEAFAIAWSKGETGVDELDDDEASSGRKKLAAWLKKEKVAAPKQKPFDFQAWLDTGDGYAAANVGAKPLASAPTETMAKLGPKLRAVASIIGLRADDPRALAYVEKTLGKKMPVATTESSTYTYVIAPKQGLELFVGHDVDNDRYPPIAKTPRSFLPYVFRVDVSEKLGEAALCVPWAGADEKAVTAILGPPTSYERFLATDKKPTTPTWTYDLDRGLATQLQIELRGRLRVRVCIARNLGRELETSRTPSLGVFVGWAALRGLLDESRFSGHASLLADVKAKKQPGLAIVAAAMPRGLRDIHLKNDDELRHFAYGWFHNLGSAWIEKDLKALKLTDDSPASLAKATPIFDRRFAKWLNAPRATAKRR